MFHSYFVDNFIQNDILLYKWFKFLSQHFTYLTDLHEIYLFQNIRKLL